MAQQEEDVLAFDPKETINGFNYKFSKNLLFQTQRLELEGEIYVTEGSSSDYVHLTTLGAMCLNQLRKQLVGDDEGFSAGTRVEMIEIHDLFTAARKFLAIMRVKQ